MSNNRRRKAYPRLKRGPNGRFCCRWCGTEVQPPKRTFCSDACVHEWRIRSDAGYVRQCLRKRDHGVCALCGRDCTALEKELAALKRANWVAWGQKMNELGIPRSRSSLWDADHIIPVVEGGGECGLENYRTLCYVCHKAETAALRSRIAERRRQQAQHNDDTTCS